MLFSIENKEKERMKFMLNLQLEIFLLLALGFWLGKSGRISQKAGSQLNWLEMNIILPCSIAKAFQMEMSMEILRSTIAVLSLSVVLQLFFFLLSRFLWKGVKDEQKQINLSYGTLANNAGTLGMVIAGAALGDTGILYASIYMIPVRVLMWSAGIAMYAKNDSGKKKSLLKTVLLHPCIVAIYFGCIFMAMETFQIALPEFLQMSLNSLAGCNLPLIMIVTGIILSQVSLHDLFDPLLYLYSLLRLIVFPMAVFAVLYFLGIRGSVFAICVLETAMPAPVTMVMLANTYKCADTFASRIVFVSTLLSILTLPVLSYIVTLLAFL
jgi:hypothetical protein